LGNAFGLCVLGCRPPRLLWACVNIPQRERRAGAQPANDGWWRRPITNFKLTPIWFYDMINIVKVIS
jgi:hypothetical protein